jgi:UDP-N-acetylglucosamine 4-epimerase
MIEGHEVTINGDGETSRDFCYIANAIQANLLGATTRDGNLVNQVYNVAVGDQLSLNELYAEIRGLLLLDHPHLSDVKPKNGPFRSGDVRYSLADVAKARRLLGYEPTHRVVEGLNIAVKWYVDKARLLSPDAGADLLFRT